MILVEVIQAEIGRINKAREKQARDLEAPGNLARLVRGSVAIMALVSAALFAGASGTSLSYVILLAGGMGARFVLSEYTHSFRPLPRTVAYLLQSGLVILYVSMTLSGGGIVSISRFLILFMLLNYLTRMRYSEYRGIFMASSLLTAAGIYVDPSANLLYRMPLYLAAAGTALGALTMLRARISYNEKFTGGAFRTGIPNEDEPKPRNWTNAAAVMTMLLAGTMALGAAVFFLFPRLNLPLPLPPRNLAAGGNVGSYVDGTPAVSFNSLADAGNDDTVIFKVKIYRPGDHSEKGIYDGAFRMRSMAFSRYVPARNAWMEPSGQREILHCNKNGVNWGYRLSMPPRFRLYADPKSPWLAHKVVVEPAFRAPADWWGLPSAGTPDYFLVDKSLETDSEGNVLVYGCPELSGPRGIRNEYHVRFRKQHVDIAKIRFADAVAPNPRYLLDAGAISEASFALYKNWTQGLHSEYDKAARVEEILSVSGMYSYDLDITDTIRGNPAGAINTLLLETHSGHCGLYATAMALLLRHDGIPTRVVSGFHVDPGTWEADTGTYSVRRLDAHAWVEVFFRGFGWVPFEPTPGNYNADDPRGILDDMAQRRGGRRSGGGVGNRHGNKTDYSGSPKTNPESIRPESIKKNYWTYHRSPMDIWWNQHVMRFNRNNQQHLYRGMRNGLREGFFPSRQEWKWLGLGVGWWLLGIAALVVLLLFYPGIKRKMRRKAVLKAAEMRGEPVLGFYRELLRFLRKLRFYRRKHQTARNLAEEVAATGCSFGETVRELTDVFEHVVYGGQKISPDKEAELTNMVSKMFAAELKNRMDLLKRRGIPGKSPGS